MSIHDKTCVVCGSHSFKNLFFKQNYDFIACTVCGLVQLDPLPTPGQLDAHYTRRAQMGNYRADVSSERIRSEQKILNVIKDVRPQSPGRVFDIGCLYGQFLDLAKQAGWETWGLELQKAAAEHAGKNHDGRVFCATVEAFANQLETPAGSFDVVVASSVIEHLLDPSALVRLSHILLKEQGLLVLQTPNHGSWTRRVMGKFWPPYAAPEHTFYFSAANLRRFMEANGFTVIKVKPDIKHLRVGYVLHQLRFFGTEIQRVIAPFEKYLPQAILDIRLPFYGGEMFFIARKK